SSSEDSLVGRTEDSTTQKWRKGGILNSLPLIDRVLQASRSAGRIAVSMLGACLLLFIAGWPRSAREAPGEFTLIALSLAALAFVTFLFFGALGYKIKGGVL